jgi:hypothetical protein
MTRRGPTFFLIAHLLFSFLGIAELSAAGEINLSAPMLEQEPPDHYYVLGSVTNTTDKTREVILRAQVLFYDKAVPKGDLPVIVLRKDMTLILKPREKKELRIPILKEGFLPRLDLRVEPQLRLRRQRVWNY